MDPTPTTLAADARLPALFSAVTSAMQPARFPLALLAVLVISALAPILDLAAGNHYGARGFAGSALGESEREVAYQRARSATSRIAEFELQRLERGEGADSPDADPVPPRRVSLSEMQGAIRGATASIIAERNASEIPLDEVEELRIRERASAAMLIIASAQPRGVASVFLDGERAAAKQVFNGVVRFDAEMFLAGALGAVFSVPAAAIRAAPIVFPLGLIVLLCALTFVAGGSCRMAAVHAGRAARLSARDGASFARKQGLNLVALPILPCIVLGAMALVVVVFAFLLRVPAANLLSGLLFIIPLTIALLGAILALVTILGFPLMPAAIAVEDCDAGDAITRAGALVLARPLLWLAAIATALVVLSIGSLLVSGVLSLASNGVAAAMDTLGGPTGRALASGSPNEIDALFGPDRMAALFVGFWMTMFEALAGAYLFALACDLTARAYLLMRARIDGEHPATISGYGVR